ncbi:ADP-ribose 1''-phosphate phosphatase [Nakaseomyces bracarensis]|uniref:ADP-ribose 1''-phosphate phosphatase n=1 Tax=Nakaseomyces bracarensis TaxID=273131 RepID=A0ABR4NMK1_9SACH
MSNIRYLKGNILSTENYKRVIIHSCNANGAWGGGIAYQLAVKFPQAEEVYIDLCERFGNKLLGKCVLIPSFKDKNIIIGCLFTSSFGGGSHGSGNSILDYTEKSLNHLNDLLNSEFVSTDNANLDKEISKLKKMIDGNINDFTLEMPKINSGIFGVPWPQTESILKKFDGIIDFTVYEL